MPLVQHDHLIQILATDRSDEALDIRVLPWLAASPSVDRRPVDGDERCSRTGVVDGREEPSDEGDEGCEIA
jgi:hypothetical protein